MPTSILTIILVSIIGGLLMAAYSQWSDLQMKKLNNEADEELKAEIDALKERVEVLEKIVTDDKYALKKELDELKRAG